MTDQRMSEQEMEALTKGLDAGGCLPGYQVAAAIRYLLADRESWRMMAASLNERWTRSAEQSDRLAAQLAQLAEAHERNADLRARLTEALKRLAEAEAKIARLRKALAERRGDRWIY
jgi:septal ring factor EnvC (AmiA/AmiB activator)